MAKPREDKDMTDQNGEVIEIQTHLEVELQKAQETTKNLENDRQVSEEILHETFTL